MLDARGVYLGSEKKSTTNNTKEKVKSKEG